MIRHIFSEAIGALTHYRLRSALTMLSIVWGVASLMLLLAYGQGFEEALKKLEAIVEAMESEDLPLETLLAKYEEGTRLSRVCQEKLAEAEVKIQQLEKNAAGELKVKPLTLEESEAE